MKGARFCAEFGWYREAKASPQGFWGAKPFFRPDQGGRIMAKNKPQQEFVKEITPRDVDFAQWDTDVIRKTDMVD